MGQAMGGGLVASPENEFGSYYNPALTGLKDGISIASSFSNHYKFFPDAKFSYYSASYKIKKIGSFGLSRYKVKYSDASLTMESYYNTIYTLNYSREILKNFYGGVNINIVEPHNPGEINKLLVPIDIGLLIKIPVEKNGKSVAQLFQLGGAFYNINSVKYSNSNLDPHYFVLPSILRGGGSYKIDIKGNPIFPKSNIFSFLGVTEFEWVTNSSRYVKIKLGGEVTFIDIFSFRAGYTIGNTFERSTSGKLNGDSYGAGVKIPVDLIFQLASPLSLSIDYVNLEQPPERDWWNGVERFGRFNTVSLKLNWVPTI